MTPQWLQARAGVARWSGCGPGIKSGMLSCARVSTAAARRRRSPRPKRPARVSLSSRRTGSYLDRRCPYGRSAHPGQGVGVARVKGLPFTTSTGPPTSGVEAPELPAILRQVGTSHPPLETGPSKAAVGNPRHAVETRATRCRSRHGSRHHANRDAIKRPRERRGLVPSLWSAAVPFRMHGRRTLRSRSSVAAPTTRPT